MGKQISLRPLLYFVTTILLFTACSKEDAAEFKINPDFQKHISSFTSGVISAAAPIKIQLTEAYSKKIIPNQAIKDDFIKISPAVKGKTVWSDQYTLEFIPEERLQSGEPYWVEFHFGKVNDGPRQSETFKFPVSIIKQAINFGVDGLKSYSNGAMDDD